MLCCRCCGVVVVVVVVVVAVRVVVIAAVVAVVEGAEHQQPSRKNKRARNWCSNARKDRMTRRLQNALLYKQHLLNSKEGMTTLRKLQTSFALSSMGVRMMWEYRNERKWPVIAEYLATFAHYDLQDDAQQRDQNNKYIDFCCKKRTRGVETEMPHGDGLDLSQPNSQWFSNRPCFSVDFEEDDVDWGDNDMTRQGADLGEGDSEQGDETEKFWRGQRDAEQEDLDDVDPEVGREKDGGSVGGFDVNTSTVGRGQTQEVVDDDANTDAGSVGSMKTIIRKGKTLEQADDDVSTDAGSVRTMKTFSRAGSTSTSAQPSMPSGYMSLNTMTCVVEGSESGADIADLQDINEGCEADIVDDQDLNFLERAKDSKGKCFGAKFAEEWDSVATKEPWKLGKWNHLFGDVVENGLRDEHKVRFTWTKKTIWIDNDDGHSKSSDYKIGFRCAATATNLFGPFDLDAIPQDATTVPTLQDMTPGYGSLMPAYDSVFSIYLPSRVCISDGKKCPCMKWYPLSTCAGLGAVFWDGSGGQKTFRASKPQTPVLAKWEIVDEHIAGSEGEIARMDVYEDPRWQSHTKIDTEKHIISEGKVERLVNPDEATKIEEKGHRT